MFYTVYLIDECYVGITLKNPEQRLQEHVIQAVKNHGTRKDKYIFSKLVEGMFPAVQQLFTSTWSGEDIAVTRAENQKYTDRTALKHLAGLDEEAACIWFRDVVGCNLLNIASGTTKSNLSRAVVVGRTSDAFKKWIDSRNSSVKPLLLAKSQVRSKATNSVTFDDQETVLVITVTNITYEDHAICGPNTRVIYYTWDNSNADKTKLERFVDTYNTCASMMKGNTYRVFSEKELAPDNPETTMCWTWASREDFNFDTVKAALIARLERIEALPVQLRSWEDMHNLEVETKSTLRHLIETNAEREGKPFTTPALLQFLDK